MEESVRVAVRVRPLLGHEIVERSTECVEIESDQALVVAGSDKRFTFDYVFSSAATQRSIYGSCVAGLVEALFEGYNATCFAYGQTGSGKTFTMGSANDASSSSSSIAGGEDEQLGIIPRAVMDIFETIAEKKKTSPNAEFYLRVQFLELYGEILRDLLDPVGVAEGKTVSIREAAEAPTGNGTKSNNNASGSGIQIVGASEESVKTPQDLLKALERGTLCRTTASTKMNLHSSRSHAIFTIILEQHLPVSSPPPATETETETENGEASKEASSGEVSDPPAASLEPAVEFRTAKFHFVDLAGSERAKRTGATGKRLREGININKGLLALGNVISALGDESRKQEKLLHVPYRNSKLTRMLQDSLGGNSRTLMIACVSPADSNYEETLNTLRYANRAKNIKNNAVINRDPTTSQIAILKAQVMALKAQLMQQGIQPYSATKKQAELPQTFRSSSDSTEIDPNRVAIAEANMRRLLAELEAERQARLELEEELRATKEQLDCLHEAHQVLLMNDENDDDGDIDGANMFETRHAIEQDSFEAQAAEKLEVSQGSESNNNSSSSSIVEVHTEEEEEANDEEEADSIPLQVITTLLQNQQEESTSNTTSEGTKLDAVDVHAEMSRDMEKDEEAVQLKKKFQKTQQALRKMLSTYDKTLRSKHKIMEQVIAERKKYEAMKLHYESKMAEMNTEVRETQSQRDILDERIRDLEKKTLTEASTTEIAQLKKDLRVKNDRLRELEHQTKKLAEVEKLSAKYQKKERDILEEISVMKRAKVEFQRKIEEESKKYKLELEERAKEILSLRKMQFRLTKDKTELSAKTARDEVLIKTKTEQVTAMQRKLREAQRLAQHSQKLSAKEKEHRQMLEKFAAWRVKRDEEIQDLKIALAKQEAAIQRRIRLCDELEKLKLQAEERAKEAEAKTRKAERDKAYAEAALREAVREKDMADSAEDFVERDAIEELEQRLEVADSEILFRDRQVQAAAAHIQEVTDSLSTEKVDTTASSNAIDPKEYAASASLEEDTQESLLVKGLPVKITSIEQANEVCRALMQLFVDSKKLSQRQQGEIKRLRAAHQALENRQEMSRRKTFLAKISSNSRDYLNDSGGEGPVTPMNHGSANLLAFSERERPGGIAFLAEGENIPQPEPQSALESQLRIHTLEEQLRSLQVESDSVNKDDDSEQQQKKKMTSPVAFFVPTSQRPGAGEDSVKKFSPPFRRGKGRRSKGLAETITEKNLLSTSPGGVFERLSKPSSYTGIHKRRVSTVVDSDTLQVPKSKTAKAEESPPHVLKSDLASNQQEAPIESGDVEDEDKQQGWVRVAKKTTESYSKKLELEAAERQKKHASNVTSSRPAFNFGGKVKAPSKDETTVETNHHEESKENHQGAAATEQQQQQLPIYERLYDPRSYTGTHKRRVEENQMMAATSSGLESVPLNVANNNATITTTTEKQDPRERMKAKLASEREKRRGTRVVQER